MARLRSSKFGLAAAGFAIFGLGAVVGPRVVVTDGVAVDSTSYLLGTLLGTNEVPTAGDPDGVGSVGVYVYAGTVNDLCWTLNLIGIGTVSGAQLHSGAAGITGPVVIDFGVASTSCAGGLDPALVIDIAANPANYYVNVDTTDYPAGALRGQLVNNAEPLIFVGLATPLRAYDSRVSGVKLGPNETRDVLLLTGKDGFGASFPAVPIGAFSAQVVITVTQTNSWGFLTAHAAGTPVPATSTINWAAANTDVATGTVVRVDGASRLAITAGPNANTHVIVDVVGFYWTWDLATN